MRVIKFRAWDKWENKMIYDTSFGIYNDGVIRLYSEDNKWMDTSLVALQFTGLLDKNGKEVYEGDVVRDMVGELVEVKWQEIGDAGGVYGYGFKEEGDCEVIGNIYENSELLNSK